MSSYAGLVAVDIVAWVAISAVIGLGASFVPRRWLATDTVVTRIRPWEDQGRFYQERFRIKRWKDILPESNDLGPGRRQSKSSITNRREAAELVIETRRAEYVHWSIAACGALFWAWNPPWLAAVMTIFGLVFNAPFIAVQRYNRARARRSGHLRT